MIVATRPGDRHGGRRPALRSPVTALTGAGNLHGSRPQSVSGIALAGARPVPLRAQHAEQAVLLVVDARGEPEGVGAAVRRRTGQQAPQPWLSERLAGRRVHDVASDVVLEVVVVSANDVDAAITEVADQERAGRGAPAGRRDSQPPGRVERSTRRDTGDEAATGAELVDGAEALADRFPACARVGPVEGHEDLAVQRLCVEGLEAPRQPPVPELPAGRGDLLECRVEDIDPALPEVGGEELVAVGS